MGGNIGTYVTRFDLTYQELPPDPVDLQVTYIDNATLLFEWASGGGSTAGYRVAWTDGVSAPGDFSAGFDTADNYYVLTGLTPGQKVSLRVAARDEEDNLSYGVVATGTVGELIQQPQTQSLVASGLSDTFSQVFDTSDKDIILTVDKNNFSYVWYRPNEELGYINIDNGDRMQGTNYKTPWSNITSFDVVDCDPIGNISQIPDGAKYQNGNLVRSGTAYYHENGAVLRDNSGTWYYANGEILQNATATFWPANITMRSGTTFRYASNAILKSGSNILYPGGGTFYSPTSTIYNNGNTIRNASNLLFYETAAPLFNAGNTFLYRSTGGTMIDSVGNAFFSNGAAANFPFVFSETVGFSTVHVGISFDRVARYSIPVSATNSVHVLSGSVDYSTPLPPNPTNLFARNSEGGYSPGITLVAHARLEGDFNGDDSVEDLDLAQWEEDYGINGDSDADGRSPKIGRRILAIFGFSAEKTLT